MDLANSNQKFNMQDKNLKQFKILVKLSKLRKISQTPSLLKNNFYLVHFNFYSYKQQPTLQDGSAVHLGQGQVAEAEQHEYVRHGRLAHLSRVRRKLRDDFL